MVINEQSTAAELVQYADQIATLPLDKQEIVVARIADQLNNQSVVYMASSEPENKNVALRLGCVVSQLRKAASEMRLVRMSMKEKSLV